MNRDIPSDITIRRQSLDMFDKLMSKLKQKVGNNKIWLSIDETCDNKKRKVFNAVIGIMSKYESTDSYILNCEEVKEVNHKTAYKFIEESLNLLWSGNDKFENVLLILTDAAPYMVKAINLIKELQNSNIIHLTCMAHSIHRLCETIRNECDTTDEFISNAKKVFIKSPKRIEIFESIAPNISLPPEPVITRWWTWINAALYYANNYEIFKKVINALNSSDAKAIYDLKKCYEDKEVQLKQELAFISANLHFIPNAIKKLETKGMPLSESTQIIQNISNDIEKLSGVYSAPLKSKFKGLIEKNEGFRDIMSISRKIDGQECDEQISVELSIEDVSSFKYAPITTCDIERSFSQYKHVLEGRDLNWVFDNLRKTYILHCNYEKLM